MADALLKADPKQLNFAITQDDAQPTALRSTRVGQLFTAGWKENLLLAGVCYRMTVGGITPGGDVALITGGGAGTIVDQDQPEFGIGVAEGFFLIPISVKVAAQVDLDADGEEGNIIVATDRAASIPAGPTATRETPDNLLDGGGAFPGVAFSAFTGNITDPTVSEVLDYETVQASAGGTPATLLTERLVMNYAPEIPSLLLGPASFYGYWGGTAAVAAIASIVFASVPAAWFE